MSEHYAVMEIPRDAMGVPGDPIWHPRMSGRLMTEKQAHELRTMLAATSTTTGHAGRSSYRVVRWADAEQYKGVRA